MVDADAATRNLLSQRFGRIERPAIAFPTDRYTVERKKFMARETGCDPTVQHKIVKVGADVRCEIYTKLVNVLKHQYFGTHTSRSCREDER